MFSVWMDVYSSKLFPLFSPSGAEGEVEPAAGRHLQRCAGMCQIYLQKRVDVVLLQGIQTEHPLHDPLRRCGVCRSPGETERHAKIKYLFIWMNPSFNMFPFAVSHDLGKEWSNLQQWLQTVFLQFCGLCFGTIEQLPTGSDKDSAASTR